MHLPKAIAVMMLVTACTTTSAHGQDGLIGPAEAIERARSDPDYGVRGEFALTVKAIGAQEKTTYLNSEPDYRDPNCLTIAMPTSMVPKLEKRLGVRLDEIKDRRIVVLGVAKPVKIFFLENGRIPRPKHKFYYQVHVAVDSPTQVELAK